MDDKKGGLLRLMFFTLICLLIIGGAIQHSMNREESVSPSVKWILPVKLSSSALAAGALPAEQFSHESTCMLICCVRPPSLCQWYLLRDTE